MSSASAENAPWRENAGRWPAFAKASADRRSFSGGWSVATRDMTFIGKQKAHQKSNGQTTYRAVTEMTVVMAPASSNSSRNTDRWQRDSSSQ
jgi:hypothetical protein